MKSILDVAEEMTAIMNRMKVDYAFLGGLAVRLHGLPRQTFDVDLAALLVRDRLAEFYLLAEQHHYIVPDHQKSGWIDSVQGLAVVKLQLHVDDQVIDIDIFLVETPFFQSLIQRRQFLKANGFSAWFVSPEDLILLKLFAGRRKDFVDVGDILLIQGQLDETYMRQWAREFGILPELERALREHQPE
jgi:predicted nucleotidyltransferase